MPGSERSEKFMLAAIEEARAALLEGEVPVGAALVRDGEVLARAHNRVGVTGDPTAHAEILAMREGAKKLGSWRLTGCTLFVTVEPCAMCAGAAVNARLTRLVFGAHEERTGCCGSIVDLTDGVFLHSVMASGGFMEDECAALMREYFEKKRRA